MTVQQQAQDMISNMSDESVRFLIDIIDHMSTDFIQGNRDVTTNNDKMVANRFGMGRDIITDPQGFDSWDHEIAELFIGGNNR